MILDPDSDPVKSALVTPLMLLSSHPFHLLPEEVVDAVAALPLQPRVVTQDRQVAHEARALGGARVGVGRGARSLGAAGGRHVGAGLGIPAMVQEQRIQVTID